MQEELALAEKSVLFLGKEYEISDQLTIFVPILQKFNEYMDALIEKLVAQMRDSDYSGGDKESFAYWSQPIDEIAKDIIRSAAEVGIYDLTKFELVDNNPGYKQLKKVCMDTFESIKEVAINSISEWRDGYTAAYNEAASKITGSGVSIWTSSLGSALLYSAMEGNVLRRQAKQADEELSQAVKELNAKNQSEQASNELRIKATVYYPGCKYSIEVLISNMLTCYLNRLGAINVIDCSEISHYDINASNEIMKNLSVIPQKAEVLGKAFEKCPYNLEVYTTALELSLFDDASIDTVKYLKIENDIRAYLKDNIPVVMTTKNVREFVKNKYYIHLYALLTGVSEELYIKSKTSSVYKQVVDKYHSLSDMLEDQRLSEPFFSTIKEEDDITNFVTKRIKGIINNKDFDLLMNECGHSSLLNDIQPSGYSGPYNKKSIDDFYVTSISEMYRPIINDRIQREKEARIKKQQEEKKELEIRENEKRKRKKRTSLIITISAVAILVIGLLGIKQYTLHKQIEEMNSLYEKGKYEEALKIAEDLNDTEFISKVLEDYAKALEGESLSKAIEIYERIGTDEAKARIDVLSEYAQYEGTYVSSSWKKIGGRYGLEGEVTYDDDADELTIFIRDGKYYYEFDECQGELGTDAVGHQYGLEITVHFDYKKKYIEHVVDPHYDYFYQEVTEYYKKE